jgi:hypothetical protein
MAFIYDINKNFQPGVEPAVNTRGAYGFQPAEGSSNILNGGIKPGPVAGKYGGALEDAMAEAFRRSVDPDYMAQQRKDALEFYKAQGDQQMKYRLTNDIIANLGAGARAAFGGYQDPELLVRASAGLGNAYSRGAAATQGLANLGAGIPATRYYNV